MLITPRLFADDRGEFWECYKQSEFQSAGIDVPFVQDNHSVSTSGVVRGLHFQNPPFAQAKLIRCTQGEILDIAVDIRKGSPTLGSWQSFRLSEKNKQMLFVPEGYAHGFAVISPVACVHYKVNREYHPASEAGVIWNDPSLAIDWEVQAPITSARDSQLPLLGDASNQFVFLDSPLKAGH